MYGKIYEQTFTGSMYGSGSHIFAVWSYVIAHTKPDAMVELNPAALSFTIGEPIDRIEQAIEHFKSPDPRSRSKEFEGRRLIQKGEFIYFVPQYHKYHGFANNKERREYFAAKKREQRQRDRERQTVKSNDVKQCQTMSNNQIHSTDTETKTKTNLNGEHSLSFLEELKKDVFNRGVDIDHELENAKKWCARKGRKCTERFFRKWVERADRLVPDAPAKTTSKYVEMLPIPETTPEELERRKAIASQEMKALREKLRMPQ